MVSRDKSAFFAFEELENQYIHRASSSDELLLAVICHLKKYFDEAEDEKLSIQEECDKHNFAAIKKNRQ